MSQSSQWDTVPKRGSERQWGTGDKPRPPSVALCAAIGEPSKSDCTTDGHLQATMISFVKPLPSALTIERVRITQSSCFPPIPNDSWGRDQVACSSFILFLGRCVLMCLSHGGCFAYNLFHNHHINRRRYLLLRETIDKSSRGFEGLICRTSDARGRQTITLPLNQL